MKKGYVFGLAFLFVIAIVLSSCGGGPRKCAGKRGVRTPMGVM